MSESQQSFTTPSWAGKPPPGLHLDVVKNSSVLQKLLIDDKPCYFFGRNKDTCEFPLQHQSCSRQHAALVYHKHLGRPFLVDLGSSKFSRAHGTFVGSLRLEPFKPTQIPIDTTISFGASTRTYTLRERPQAVSLVMEDVGGGEGEGGGLLGLPELDNEVDDLTQYNTAHNRQISTVGIREDERTRKRKARPRSVSFYDEEEVINPEDIDPSIGRFRNMVQTTIIPAKKKRVDGEAPPTPTSPSKFTQPLSSPTALYPDSSLPVSPTHAPSFGITSSLLTKTISAAPPVAGPGERPALEATPTPQGWSHAPSTGPMPLLYSDIEPKKKKYAKEAWPGKKPAHLLL